MNNEVMMAMRKLLLTLFATTFLLLTTTAFAQSVSDDDALSAAAHDACGRQVVLMGESATHGDGHTEAFKVALVKRLVNQCGFDSVLFEASHYEFVNISRHLRLQKAITEDQLSSAIGGLWKFDQEFKPLVPFLLHKAVEGQISLGGIDDQLGQLGQDFSNVTLISNLAMVLPKPETQECQDVMHSRVYSEGYKETDAPKVLTCLADIRQYYAADNSRDRINRDEWLEMIDAIQRWVKRDTLSVGEQIVARDRSMFLDFQWLRQQQPKRHKVILWMATVHASKEGDPTWGDKTGANFGSLLHSQYGERAFTLGFTSLGGNYRQGSKTLDQPLAPSNSLEAQVFKGTNAGAVFVGTKQLSSFGAIPAAIFRHSYQTLRWDRYIDGVVIFRDEHPPTRQKQD